MGEATVYLAEVSGDLVGALTVVMRTAEMADGSTTPVAYICDAKVAAGHRGGSVLARLALAARDDIMPAGITAAYSVAMSGSTRTDTLTGRIGIPPFREIARLAILRFDTGSGFHPADPTQTVLSAGHHRFRGGNACITSKIVPLPVETDGARGTLVDTRAGKRLWQSDGMEILSAHLTGLVFESPRSLVELIKNAMALAAKLEFPGLFLSLPADAPYLGQIIGSTILPPTVAGATVFATGLTDGPWQVETSEI
jgi:hypothetical protein